MLGRAKSWSGKTSTFAAVSAFALVAFAKPTPAPVPVPSREQLLCYDSSPRPAENVAELAPAVDAANLYCRALEPAAAPSAIAAAADATSPVSSLTLDPSLIVDCIAPADLEAAQAAHRVVDAKRIAIGAGHVEAGECVRCHTAATLGLEPEPRGRSCSGCHAWIAESRHDSVERAHGQEQFPLWDRYVERVDSFLAVPDLAASGARLDPQWVARYLRAPYKVRPGLREEMIRTRFDESEAEAVATWLASLRPVLAGVALQASMVPLSTRSADVRAGERLYSELRCSQCHAFGDRAATPGHPAAPDLRLAGERMRPADIAAFIADPAAFGGRTVMPDHGLTARQAARLRDFILFTKPGLAKSTDARAELALLSRAVAWDEVNDEVFGAICVHCHMNAEENGGDGGPGNTGGLGYEGVGLDLSSWDGLMNGVRAGEKAGGTRASIVSGGDDSRLIKRLRMRYLENAREVAGALAVAPHAGDVTAVGMPMGLAPLSRGQLQLIRTWVAQGAPGPKSKDELAAVAGSQERGTLEGALECP